MCEFTYLCIFMHMYTCIYVCIYLYMYICMYVYTLCMYACARRLFLCPFPRVLLLSRDTWKLDNLLVDTRALFNGNCWSQLQVSVCLSVCLSVYTRQPPIHHQLNTLVTCYKPSHHKTSWNSGNVHLVPVDKFPSFPTITGGIQSDTLGSLSLGQLCLLTFLY